MLKYVLTFSLHSCHIILYETQMESRIKPFSRMNFQDHCYLQVLATWTWWLGLSMFLCYFIQPQLNKLVLLEKLKNSYVEDCLPIDLCLLLL